MDLITAKASKTTSQVHTTSGVSRVTMFTCSGTLTSLVLGVDVRTETRTRNLYPKVSLWRPREDDGFVKVSGSGRTVRLTAANFSTSGAFEYTLDSPLPFRVSDILCWEQPELAKSVVRMYAMERSVSSSSDDDSTRDPSAALLYPVTGELDASLRSG